MPEHRSSEKCMHTVNTNNVSISVVRIIRIWFRLSRNSDNWEANLPISIMWRLDDRESTVPIIFAYFTRNTCIL